jgi:hypothetical protein
VLPVDEQDRIIAGHVPAALDGAEREVIKTAYAMATYRHASQRSLDFPTFVIGWVACLGVHRGSRRPGADIGPLRLGQRG